MAALIAGLAQGAIALLLGYVILSQLDSKAFIVLFILLEMFIILMTLVNKAYDKNTPDGVKIIGNLFVVAIIMGLEYLFYMYFPKTVLVGIAVFLVGILVYYFKKR